MNWQQALEAMSNGCKVKHFHFTDEEYFWMRNGIIRDEHGYNMSSWYKGEDWQNTMWYIL